MSLDVFRGATIASMMLVNNPGSWDHVYPPLEHAPWHGWTFTDTVFPFFLWIVGVAVPFSIGRRVEAGERRDELVFKIFKRAIVLFAVGLFLNAFSYFWKGAFSLEGHGFGYWMSEMAKHVRYPGVLQRIGICYLFAGLIFLNTKIRGQMIWTAALLAIYTVLMRFGPAIFGFNSPDLYAVHGNFSEWIDTMVFNGHVFRDSTTYDPEGIISTIPAIATTLFGILTGHLLRCQKFSATEKTVWLFVGGTLLMFAGNLFALWQPINKRLWTASYSIFMAGLAMNVFAVYYWLVDIKGWRAWAKPLAIYGMNAITVFVLAGLIGRLTIEIKVAGGKMVLKTWLYNHTFGALADPKGINLLSADVASMLWGLIVYCFGLYLVAYVMYRRKWFVKF